jgi:hypothetical protein
MSNFKDISEMPADLRFFFGAFGSQLYDSYCGEPVAWGYSVLSRLGDDKWSQASEYGTLEYSPGTDGWFLITKVLTSDEARAQYGEITNLELGPRGGFKSVTYGSTKFGSKRLDPRK